MLPAEQGRPWVLPAARGVPATAPSQTCVAEYTATAAALEAAGALLQLRRGAPGCAPLAASPRRWSEPAQLRRSCLQQRQLERSAAARREPARPQPQGGSTPPTGLRLLLPVAPSLPPDANKLAGNDKPGSTPAVYYKRPMPRKALNNKGKKVQVSGGDNCGNKLDGGSASGDPLLASPPLGGMGSGKSWTEKEDVTLSLSYRAAVQDEVTGVDQSKRDLWQKIHEGYVALIGESHLPPDQVTRSARALESRWPAIAQGVHRFKDAYRRVTKANLTGNLDENDLISAATAMVCGMDVYEGVRADRVKDVKDGRGRKRKPKEGRCDFVACWKVLRSLDKFSGAAAASHARREGVPGAAAAKTVPRTKREDDELDGNTDDTDAYDGAYSAPPLGRKARKLQRLEEALDKKAARKADIISARAIAALADSSQTRTAIAFYFNDEMRDSRATRLFKRKMNKLHLGAHYKSDGSEEEAEGADEDAEEKQDQPSTDSDGSHFRWSLERRRRRHAKARRQRLTPQASSSSTGGPLGSASTPAEGASRPPAAPNVGASRPPTGSDSRPSRLPESTGAGEGPWRLRGAPVMGAPRPPFRRRLMDSFAAAAEAEDRQPIEGRGPANVLPPSPTRTPSALPPVLPWPEQAPGTAEAVALSPIAAPMDAGLDDHPYPYPSTPPPSFATTMGVPPVIEGRPARGSPVPVRLAALPNLESEDAVEVKEVSAEAVKVKKELVPADVLPLSRGAKAQRTKRAVADAAKAPPVETTIVIDLTSNGEDADATALPTTTTGKAGDNFIPSASPAGVAGTNNADEEKRIAVDDIDVIMLD